MVCLLGLPNVAFAYVDGGAASMTYQVIVASVLSGAVGLRVAISVLRRLLPAKNRSIPVQPDASS